MSTYLNFGRDIQGYNAYAPIPSHDIFYAKLDTTTPEDVVVPSNHKTWIVIITYPTTVRVYMSLESSAIPASDPVFTTGTTMLLPGIGVAKFTVFAGQHISFATPDTNADVTVAFYAVGNN